MKYLIMTPENGQRTMKTYPCRMKEQGYERGSCLVLAEDSHAPACQATLQSEKNTPRRLITSLQLSRPENYLSIYQSGCNFSCKKCHSWYFSKIKDGIWYSPDDILKEAREYEKKVTLIEPRDKATAWHSHDTCRCCGWCVMLRRRSDLCPSVLDPEAIVLSPQGFGPARNIVAFTGGDLTCHPEFYGECAQRIKSYTRLWVLIETNGYGLTAKTLDYLKSTGVDAFWLDIKAFDPEKHRWLTGCNNDHILKLPEEILKRDFILEVLSLHIPGLVEGEEIENIAHLLASVDPTIPFTILAFFPEYKMKDFRKPTVEEMVDSYQRARRAGLKNIRLGNVGIFAPSERDRRFLMSHVEKGAF